MKKLNILLLLIICFGCTKKFYNVKVVEGVGYVAYSERKKGETSKDIMSTGDTLCAMFKPPYSIFIIYHLTKDTTYLIK